MRNNFLKEVRIRQKFYRLAALLLSVIVAITAISILMLVDAQSDITDEYEESTLKYNAINNLEDSLNQTLFRARGYYAFQEQRELDLLEENLGTLSDDIDYFGSLTLTNEEEELHTILSEFYEDYTDNILPTFMGFVEADDYESLREAAGGGTNTAVNQFLNYTRNFNQEVQNERETVFDQVIGLINNYTIGFILLGLTSFSLLFLFINRLLKDIIEPLDSMVLATDNLKKGKSSELDSNYELTELSRLAYSFNEMAEEVQEKEAKLVSQNQKLEQSQNQLQEYVTEIEHINKALNQSALMCITNDKGIILDANDKFSETSKYSKEELIGQTTRMLKSGSHNQLFYEKLWKTINKGKIWTGQLQNETKAGEKYWINATIVPFLDENGKAYRYILIGIDITENKHNEQTLKRLLHETQRAKEKTESYSNLNKELTATVNREEFLNRVFDYFMLAFNFDKGILVSTKQAMYAAKGLGKQQAERFLTEEYSAEIKGRLKSESHVIIKREASTTEIGMAQGNVNSYDLYAPVRTNQGDIELIMGLTRIGHSYSDEEVSEITFLLGQLSLALSRINSYEAVQRERSLNESIVENVTEGLQLVSLKGELLQANGKVLDLVNIDSFKSQTTLPKKAWMNQFTEKWMNPKRLKTFFTQAMDPATTELMSLRCQLKDNQSRHIQIYTSPVFIEGEKTGTVFMYRDITKEYEVDEMKSELVSTVSHELRTPLSSVLGFTEMLLMKELKPEKQKKYLEIIFKEAKRLTNLINDFLDVQRIESGKQEYEMEEVTLNKIVMEVIDTFRHEQKHQIYLIDSANMTTVYADRERLIQLFTNLISNAVKFSPEGGKVAVQLINKNERIQVTIKDDGIGIPDEELSDLFTKFKRIDNSTRKKIGGTGLGLAISKGIVEAHQGDIRIESKEGEGTAVIFSLPIVEAGEKQELSGSRDEHAEVTRGNVMLVEDDISLAMMLSESLKSSGFNVVHYLNSKNVLAIADEREFTAIVVDLVLEDGLTGWDLIKAIKGNSKTRQIPVVVSSAVDKSAELMEEYSIVDYLLKPYSPDILTNLMIELSKRKTN